MLKKYAIVILLISFIAFTGDVMAQLPPGPCGGPGQPPCPPGAPIDGGVGLLLILGIGYAVNKLRKKE